MRAGQRGPRSEPHAGREMKFPIHREARDRYQFDPALFTGAAGTGFHAARVFTQRMNETRDLVRFPEQAVSAGEINALSLIDEIFRYVVQAYCDQKCPDACARAEAS